MRALGLAFILVLMGSTVAAAALQFPALTGRVVDEAHILSPSAITELDQILADYENGTTNQVVVVTLSSLQGTSIEDYGYQLGRHWQIGQKGKNNGVLLIVAPHEHKVRIEVGYGLEPVLTDAAASQIVNGIILPQFRAGNMPQGIIQGTRSIVSVLGGKAVPHRVSSSNEVPDMVMGELQLILMLLFFIWLFRFARQHPVAAAWMLSNSSSRFSSSRIDSGWGGGFGGGFSGGGGSFGGGGASGSW